MLRLMCSQPLDRLSTDLDLSSYLGTDMPSSFGSTEEMNIFFASQLGRAATEILRRVYSKGDATVTVTFDRESPNERDPTDPHTLTYPIIVTAILRPGKKTEAKSQRYKIDLTCDEYVDRNLVVEMNTMSYGIPIAVLAYAPLQSISEKLRAILQKHRHFDRGQNSGNWVPRHLLDLVPLSRMITDYTELPALFRKNANVAGLSLMNIPDHCFWTIGFGKQPKKITLKQKSIPHGKF